MAPKNWTWKKLFSSNQRKTLGRLLPRIWSQPAHHLKQLSYQKYPLCLFILLFNVQKIHPLQDFQVLQVLCQIFLLFFFNIDFTIFFLCLFSASNVSFNDDEPLDLVHIGQLEELVELKLKSASGKLEIDDFSQSLQEFAAMKSETMTKFVSTLLPLYGFFFFTKIFIFFLGPSLRAISSTREFANNMPIEHVAIPWIG